MENGRLVPGGVTELKTEHLLHMVGWDWGIPVGQTMEYGDTLVLS